ncbi:hypothetical protein B0H13DRAFT_2314407 [Mycena leptocephala]|nr:hypothetical protein B0H13DRAFT_2314407 [Mycena leptocephala]
MAPSSLHKSSVLISLSIQVLKGASLPACPARSESDYDFVVVGAGAGGGPVAARLDDLVLVVDAGHEVVGVNTSIGVYLGRAVEDPQLELNYTYE